MADKKLPRPGRPEPFRPQNNLEALRVPPHSPEAEQNVLGGLMLAPERLERVKLVLTEADFYRRDHRLIFRSIVEVADKNKPIDPVVMAEWLEAQCLSEQVGGPSYIIELSGNTHSAANILAYAEIVREKSLLRQAIQKGTELVNLGFNPEGKDAGEVLSQGQSALTSLALTATNAQLMRPADLRSLAGEKVQAPRFVMAPYFPRRVVTLVGGHGGAGKSTLALIHAAHVAAGRWWAGKKVEPGKVVLFSLEDDGRTVGFRLQNIIAEYGLDAEAVYANFQVFDWSEGDTALVVEKAEYGIHTLEQTSLFARLKVAAVGADLVLIDNASDAFDGNENSKRQVKAFFRMLTNGIAQPNDCAVVLLAHIDKNAARYGAAGNSYTGSTAWHNSSRSRLALVESKEEGLELRHEKANFGKKCDPLPLRMAEHGVLVPCAAGESGGTSTLNEGQDAAGVLAAIRAAAVAGTSIGTGRLGPGNAHLVLATFGALPARLRQAKGRDAFFAALDSLVASGRVVIAETYVNRNRRRHYVEAGTEPSSLLIPPHPPTSEPTKPTKAGSRSDRQLGEGTGTNETHETNETGASP
jgi:hypothetical protein